MANKEQLRILLEQDVEAWNKWREDNPDVEIDLAGADLRSANLNSANLRDACLSDVNLGSANLFGADLRGANLNSANLSRAYLIGANLSRAYLIGAYLYSSNLHSACLRDACLTDAYLYIVKALRTDFSNAILTGACIEDWSINSETNFENIICDYIYLKTGNQKRRPANGNFKHGEFALLVQKSLETVDLIFKDGIDWRAFLTTFQDLRVEYGEQNVSIQAIEKKSDSAFVIRLSVSPDADEAKKAEIESYAKQSYETKLKVLEAQYREKLKAKDDQIAIYRQHNTSLENIVGTLAGRPIQNIIDITNTAESTSMSDTHKSKYDLSNANVGGIVDTAQSGSHQEFTQHNYASEQKQTLAEAAEEIQNLLKQLEQTNPTATEAQQIEHLNDETTPKFKRKAVAALKAAGDTALDEFLDNSYVKVGKAAIMGWIEA